MDGDECVQCFAFVFEESRAERDGKVVLHSFNGGDGGGVAAYGTCGLVLGEREVPQEQVGAVAQRGDVAALGDSEGGCRGVVRGGHVAEGNVCLCVEEHGGGVVGLLLVCGEGCGGGVRFVLGGGWVVLLQGDASTPQSYGCNPCVGVEGGKDRFGFVERCLGRAVFGEFGFGSGEVDEGKGFFVGCA